MRFARELTLTHPYPVRRVLGADEVGPLGRLRPDHERRVPQARRRARTRARRPATPPTTTPRSSARSSRRPASAPARSGDKAGDAAEKLSDWLKPASGRIGDHHGRRARARARDRARVRGGRRARRGHRARPGGARRRARRARRDRDPRRRVRRRGLRRGRPSRPARSRRWSTTRRSPARSARPTRSTGTSGSQAIATNLFGTVLMCRAVLRGMRERGYGKIVNLSGGGATAPRPNFSAYATAKAASCASPRRSRGSSTAPGIDVNAIAPGRAEHAHARRRARGRPGAGRRGVRGRAARQRRRLLRARHQARGVPGLGGERRHQRPPDRRAVGRLGARCADAETSTRTSIRCAGVTP